MFTIPCDFVFEGNREANLMRKETLALVKKQLDWIELIPHGLLHTKDEFKNCDYKTMMDYVFPAIDETFKKDGLPYVKGFKAPYWLWNKDVVKALNDKGWWGAIDRKGWMLRPKKVYVYTHSIDEWFSESNLPVIKLHGHITGMMDNGIEKCFTNLFRMPPDAEFKFASEMVETIK
jgi:predicted deacetylase